MAFGVTPSGFVRKTLAEIKKEIEDDQRNNINSGLNLTSTSVFGQINGIMSAQLDELWQLAQAVYSSQYPDSASAAALDDVANLVGVTRLPAAKSSVTLTLNLAAGVTVPLGSEVSLSGTGQRFLTTAAVTNAAAFSTNVTVAAEAQDDGPVEAAAQSIDTIETPVTGWSSKTAIISANSELYTSLSGKFLRIGIDPGNGLGLDFQVDFTTETTAAQVAATITSIISSMGIATDAGGFVRIENNSDSAGNSLLIYDSSTALADFDFPTGVVKGFNSTNASVGRFLETDSQLRLRRIQSLTIRGASTLEAIRSGVNQLNGVSETQVFENTTLTRDNNGREAKSFEVIVQGGVDQEIADKIFELKPAGISTSTSAPRIQGTGKQNFTLDTKDLDIEVDGVPQTTVVFSASDITAVQVADKINSTIIGGTDGPVTAIALLDGTVFLLHDENLLASSLEVTGGTAVADLGFPSGVKTTLFETETVADSQAFTHIIKFVRPTSIQIFISLTVTTDSRLFPLDGVQLIKDALVALGNLQKLGEDVIALKFKCEVLTISGVVDVPTFNIDTVASPAASDNIVINSDSLATFAEGDMVVDVL
jgi:hypothetical protein